ncbi:MAG: mechanosensitive ion channel family protein, partial [Phycisphaerae bacterium]|nr:mechanosensitive ion channel family protein [Phycisphaerae bacterium]
AEQGQPAAATEAEAAQEPLLNLSAYFPDWARRPLLFDVAAWQFILLFLFLLAGLVAKKITDYVFEGRIIPLFKKTRFRFDNMLTTALYKPLGFLFLLAGVFGAVAVLRLPAEDPNARGLVFGALKLLLATDVIWFLFRLVDVLMVYLLDLAGRTESKLDDQLVPLVRKALKVSIGVIGFVWIVQMLGYSVSALLAGLGIGGLAVALALQDTLSNFFGSIVLFVDRPFRIGDWVKISDVEGTVEQIGFRSTRVRTWPKTLVTIPNKQVANSTVDNCSQMPKRRVMITVGVTYETKANQMEAAVAAIRQILESDGGVDQEFIVVRFTDFGASSLDILVYYFTKDIPLPDHLAVKERVNLAIMRAIEKLDLSIAFPTRTVYLEGDIARQLGQSAVQGGEEKGKPGA